LAFVCFSFFSCSHVIQQHLRLHRRRLAQIHSCLFSSRGSRKCDS
jgi:hypothetical protein